MLKDSAMRVYVMECASGVPEGDMRKEQKGGQKGRQVADRLQLPPHYPILFNLSPTASFAVWQIVFVFVQLRLELIGGEDMRK
jgi:hypothetical protein